MNEIIDNENKSENEVEIDVKGLIKRIENMPEQHLQIFQIIQNDSARFSQNQNGVFINLLNIPDLTLKKINEFVCSVENRNSYIKQSQATLDKTYNIQNHISLTEQKQPSKTSIENNDSFKLCNNMDIVIDSLNSAEKKAINSISSKISRRKTLQLQSQKSKSDDIINKKITKWCSQSNSHSEE